VPPPVKTTIQIKNIVFNALKKIFLGNKESEKDYNPLALIKQYHLEDNVFLVNDFIPNEDVAKYFQTADCGILFYEYATPSGVESINYNFKLPILATNVGHFPETIQDGFNGYLAQPNNIKDMCRVMELSITNPINRNNVSEKAKNMSWENYAKAIINSNV